ncbi:MAG TPA: hypothetical protein VM163_03075 [bacterium]|nr:hypothetical protein [bacterium]
MRSLSATLLAEQKQMSVTPLVKLVLTHGETTHEYDLTRILKLTHNEEAYSHKLSVVLENADGALSALDLKGYKAALSFGLVTGEGDEVSACAPQWVLWHQLDSAPGLLRAELTCVGIPNLLAEDRASAKYLPEASDTKTVKTLIQQICGATLSCFSHCKAYEVVFDSEDSLIGSYCPKDGFRVYVNGSRLASLRRLIDYTHCVMRFAGDGKVHILNPTITGEVYDQEYTLESGHTFFSKAYRRTLVMPNYLSVSTPEDAETAYAGYASDEESIDALGYAVRQFEQCALVSNAQADAIAAAILSKYRLWSERGAANAPMNVGAEIWDYVKVTDQRQEDYRVGNIGSLTRTYNAGEPGPSGSRSPTEFSLRFSFGGWLSVRALLSDIETYPSGFGNAGQDLSRLSVKDLYAENITAENIDMAWLDPDNTIDLSQIGDTLDNLPDGQVYARVKTVHIDAEGGIKLDEYILYAEGYNPSLKEPKISKQTTAPEDPEVGDLWLDTSDIPNMTYRWSGAAWLPLAATNLDVLPDGNIYQRVKSAALSSDGLVLLDQVNIGSVYDLVAKTDITAHHVKLSYCVEDSAHQTVSSYDKGYWDSKPDDMDDIDDGAYWKKVYYTEISAGHIKVYSGTVFQDEWYSDGAGTEIDERYGITIGGVGGLMFKYGGTLAARLYADSATLRISAAGRPIVMVGTCLQIPSFNAFPSATFGRMFAYAGDNRFWVYRGGAWHYMADG